MDNHQRKRERITALITDLESLKGQLLVLDQTKPEGSGLIRQAVLKNLDYSLDSMENSVSNYLRELK